jgi:hypothetical protein
MRLRDKDVGPSSQGIAMRRKSLQRRWNSPNFDISVHREAPTYLPRTPSRIHCLRIGRRKPFLNSMLSHLTLLVSLDS